MDIGVVTYFGIAVAVVVVPAIHFFLQRNSIVRALCIAVQFGGAFMLVALTRALFAQQSEPLIAYAAGAFAVIAFVIIIAEMICVLAEVL